MKMKVKDPEMEAYKPQQQRKKKKKEPQITREQSQNDIDLTWTMAELFTPLNGLMVVGTIQEKKVQAKKTIREPQSIGNTLIFLLL